MVRYWILTFLCGAITLLFTEKSFADYISPGDVSVKTVEYSPESTNFEEGTYEYEVSWQGIKVGKAHVSVKDHNVEKKDFFHVVAKAKTASFIDIFYKLRHTSESFFSAESLAPRWFYSYNKENSREKIREISFKEDGKISATSKKNGRQGNPLEFSSDNQTMDPISAAFVARSLPIKLGERYSFDVFNGKHRYLITFSVEGREEITLDGRKHDTFRVVPSVQKLTDTKGENRLKSATLWISAGPSREVLKMKSKVLVGSVSAKLLRFKPKSTVPSDQIHAGLPKGATQVLAQGRGVH